VSTQTGAPEAAYADLAQVAVSVAREIRLVEHESTDGAVVLTPSNAQVMRYIDAHPGAKPSEAAAATGLLRSNLSAAVRELEQLGFIERRHDEQDGRGFRLYATETAARGLAAIRSQWATALDGVLESPNGVAEATALLERIADGLAAERRRADRRAQGRAL